MSPKGGKRKEVNIIKLSCPCETLPLLAAAGQRGKGQKERGGWRRGGKERGEGKRGHGVKGRGGGGMDRERGGGEKIY